jgi:hypothetical protein
LGFFRGAIYSRLREEKTAAVPHFAKIMSVFAQSPSKEGNIDEEFGSFGDVGPCLFDFRLRLG